MTRSRVLSRILTVGGFVAATAALVLSLSHLVNAWAPQVSSGTWAPIQPDSGSPPVAMREAREGAAAVLLDDGRVLIAGGVGVNGAMAIATAEVFDLYAGDFAPVGSMSVARRGHTAVKLADGRVLVTGGTTNDGTATDVAEVFDPRSNLWSPAGLMATARSGHTASLLKDGRVLLAGGEGSERAGATLEAFDPGTGTFGFIGVAMSAARKNHAAAVLANGDVLIVGGSDAGSLASTNIYHAATGLVSAGPSLNIARAGLTATALPDGSVLVAGGSNGSSDVAAAEIYTGSGFAMAGSLEEPRRGHLAFLLPQNNQVLIVGGTSNVNPAATAELYRPWGSAFVPTGWPAEHRTGAAGSPLALDGLLLIAGGSGSASAESYGFATLRTDADVYTPDGVVTVTGRGWEPGETVTLLVRHATQTQPGQTLPATADAHGRIARTLVADAGGEGGRFHVTAVGIGSQAQAAFAVVETTIGATDSDGEIELLSVDANNALSTDPDPKVWTNKDDYLPHEMVLMLGSGFRPDETVTLALSEDPPVHANRIFTAIADDLGNFQFDGFAPEAHHVGVRFFLTATGQTSGFEAQTTFTDDIVPGLSTTNHNGDPAASQLTLQKPTTVVAGDFMIAQVTIEGFDTGHVICTPGGWSTQMTPSIASGRTNNSTSVVQQVFWRVATAADTAVPSYTWEFRTNGASCGVLPPSNQVTGKGAVGGIIEYSGVDTGHASGPISHFAGATGGSTTVAAPSVPIPSVPAGSRVIRYFGNDKEFVISTAPGTAPATGSTLVYSVNRAKSGGGFQKPSGAASDGEQAATGNTGTVLGSNSGNGGNWVAQTVVLRELPDPPTVTVAVSPLSAAEDGPTNLVYTFTRTTTGGALTVNFSVGGTATFGTDYGQTGAATFSSSTGTVTFAAGSATATVTVDPTPDSVDEPDDTVILTVTPGTGYTVGSPASATGTITDDDEPPSLSINDVTLAEGNAGTTDFAFTVTLSAVSGQTVTVNFATANGTSTPATGGAACTPGVDYISQGGTLTFTPGDTSETLTVAVCADALDEANETFVVDLSAAGNATIADNQGLGTITDDDGSPSLSIDDVMLAEGTGTTTDFVFTATLSAASGQTVTVNFATADGTTTPATGGAACTLGVDYISQSGTLTFTPGDTSETVTVAVCADALDETNETFVVDLSTASNATIADNQGLGTITDDDDPPSLSIDDVTLAEGTGTTTNFVFTATLSAASSQTVTVNFATANGTTAPATGGAACTLGVDYISQNGTLTFTPGDTSETVIVAVCADSLDEANETFVVDLSTASNATIADNQGLGTITDDDDPPSLSIDDVTLAEGNAGTTDFVFTVTLSAVSGQTLTVNFATADGTTNSATGGLVCGAGVDYESQNGTLTFLPATTTQTVTAKVCADIVFELNETFFVNLSGPTNATISDGQGVGTIVNDDAAPVVDRVGPVTSDVVANPNPVPVNTSFKLTATVDDTTTGNSNIASAEYTIDGATPWTAMSPVTGQSFNSSPLVDVEATVPGQSAGVYNVCVRGTDTAGNTGLETCILVAVYDPDAGFVTGGGWINSPAGAYPSDVTLTGKATFGFVSKYLKGAQTPTGQTEFQFKAASLNFHSTSYEWLVVSGKFKAIYKGDGTINNAGDYGFMLSAIDGQQTGGGGTDKFRIRIWDKATGIVVYDNQLGADAGAEPTTGIGGGNIVIHTK